MQCANSTELTLFFCKSQFPVARHETSLPPSSPPTPLYGKLPKPPTAMYGLDQLDKDLHTVHWKLFTVQCTLKMCTVHCKLEDVYCVHYTGSCALCIVNWKLFTVHCTLGLCTVHCSLEAVNCVLYTGICGLNCTVVHGTLLHSNMMPFHGLVHVTLFSELRFCWHPLLWHF